MTKANTSNHRASALITTFRTALLTHLANNKPDVELASFLLRGRSVQHVGKLCGIEVYINPYRHICPYDCHSDRLLIAKTSFYFSGNKVLMSDSTFAFLSNKLAEYHWG